MSRTKPKLFLLPGDDLSVSSLAGLHSSITGREPTKREVQAAERMLAQHSADSSKCLRSQRGSDMGTLSAIPIRQPYIDWILEGSKTWEIRSKPTKKIGPVALIRSGSGTVVGVARLTKVIELTSGIARANAKHIHVSQAEATNLAGLFAWVLEDVIRLDSPVRYHHRPGAVTWVTLDEETARAVDAEAKRSHRP